MANILDLIKKLCPNGVEYKKLGKVCELEKGTQLNKSLFSDSYEYEVFNGGSTPSGFWKDFNTSPNSIAISQGGASAGFVNWIEKPFFAGAHCYTISKTSVNIKYLYFYLKFREEKIQGLKKGAGIPGLSKKDLIDFPIPIPPLSIQEEIVKKLDAFSDLVSNISIGLPAEIEARKKQYEYYREKLLAFN